MATNLTRAAVLKLRPGPERIEIHDKGCKGLTLIIRPSGLKTWAMRFRLPSGDLFRLTLGPVDLSDAETEQEPELGKPMTLAAARRMAAEVQRKRALGHDFRAAKHRQKFERDRERAKTFAKAAEDFIQQHSIRRVRGWKLQARSLGLRPKEQQGEGRERIELEHIPGGLAERWRDRPLVEIDGDDIHALIREVREDGVPGLGRKNLAPSDPRARTVFADLSKFFAWCVEDRRLKANPVVGVAKPKPPAARDRVLTDQEIIWFWKSCDGLTAPFGPCLKLLLLLGARLNEVAGMRRSEFSADGTVWTIPQGRTKNKRAHELPLPPLAQEILSGVATTGDLVFTTNGRTQISGWSKMKDNLDKAMMRKAREQAEKAGRNPDEASIKPWRLHDLRRTMATKSADLGVLPHIVEAVLNHVSGAMAGVAGIYNRSSYGPEKKVALEVWAARITSLVSEPTADAPMQRAGG